jgi:hypothetical protein
MAPSKEPKSSGGKRGAEEAKLDTEQEDVGRTTRRTRATSNAREAAAATLPETAAGDGAGPSTAAPAATAAPPSAQPQAAVDAQMNIPNIVQELNSLMLSLHSRAIENQQESTSLLAVRSK